MLSRDRIRIGDHPAIAVQIVIQVGSGPPQHDLVAADERIEGFGLFAAALSFAAGGVCWAGLAETLAECPGCGQWRHFDRGEPHFQQPGRRPRQRSGHR